MVSSIRYPLRALAIAGMVVLSCCGSAQAQDGLAFDPVSGTYSIDYVDDFGEERSLVIVPPDHVAPVIELTSVSRSTAGLSYSYTVYNQAAPNVDQSIFMVELRCPDSVSTEHLEVPPEWTREAKTSALTNRWVCEFIDPTGGIAPGANASGFQVEASQLPAITDVAVWGWLGEIQDYPGLIESRPGLIDIVSTVDGTEGGWWEGEAVLPSIEPAQLTDPGVGIDVLQNSASAACDRAWLDDSNGICHSLQVKLEQAEASIVADRPAARYQIQAFLNELDAQRGQYVDETAYWLLRILGEHVLSKI